MSVREIDRIPAVLDRAKDMQVLCLGLSRTGTLSLYTALQQLGYTPYHGGQLFMPTNSRDSKCWQEGLAERYESGKTYGRDEFNKLLGNYDVVMGCPCANFAEELIAAYPDAKIILTSRDPDAWVLSMESYYYRLLDMFSWNPIVYLEPNTFGAFKKLIRTILIQLTSGDWQNRKTLRQSFLDHNALVKSIAPKEEFLDFGPKQDWGALCQFLGKPELSGPYLRINAGTVAADNVQKICRGILLRKMKNIIPEMIEAGLQVAW